jgi:acetyl esterase
MTRVVTRARAFAVARRVLPPAVIRLAAGRAEPPFRELLAIAEESGDLPDPAPEAQPATLLRMFPELASVEVREVGIHGPHGPVAARAYLPEGPPAAALVWVHGGGFIGGTLDGAESNWVGLALARRGIAVLALDYRKAVGGVRYPVPLDDVEAGWRWAAANAADALRVNPAALHLGGASAGGCLAAGLAKKLRDAPSAPRPRTLVLAYPMLHADPAATYPADEVARLRKKSPYPLFRPEDTRELAVNYAGRASVLADPYAFPANGPLGGQPPMFILTAEFDMTRLSGQAYAAAVTEAGGAVTLVMEPGAPHGALARPSGEFGPRSLERIARWLLRKDQGG